MLKVVKYISKNVIFDLRINIFKFIFIFFRGKGYLGRVFDVISGVKKNGYFKIPNYYTKDEINEINDEILKKLENNIPPNIIKENNIRIEKREGEIKVFYIDKIINRLKIYASEFFVVLISFIFYGKIKKPYTVYHFLDDGSFNKSSLTTGKSMFRISGNYHIDSMDVNTLKCLILLDDVNETTGGQTSMISGSRKKVSHMSKKQIEMINNYDDKKKYQEIDEELNKLKILNDKNKINFYGSKGDLFFLDTSNIHRGEEIKKGYRRVLWYYF